MLLYALDFALLIIVHFSPLNHKRFFCFACSMFRGTHNNKHEPIHQTKLHVSFFLSHSSTILITHVHFPLYRFLPLTSPCPVPHHTPNLPSSFAIHSLFIPPPITHPLPLLPQWWLGRPSPRARETAPRSALCRVTGLFLSQVTFKQLSLHPFLSLSLSLSLWVSLKF